MRKTKVIIAAGILTTLLIFSTSAFAKGPINAGGKWGYAPWNPTAFDHALLRIMPHFVPLGTETIIWEEGKTITVSAIPTASLNINTGEWEGPHILLNWSRAWEAASNPWVPYYTGEWTKQAWCNYYFWMNGEKATITVDDEDPVEITEFIFMRVQYVGPGLGNSNFTLGGSYDFDVKIRSYK